MLANVKLVLFNGDPNEHDLVIPAVRGALVKVSAMSTIRDVNPAPVRAQFKSEFKYTEALTAFLDKQETAFVTIQSLIARGSHLWNSCQGSMERGAPKPLYDAIINFYGAKTLAKALEVVTAICRLIRQGGSVNPDLAYRKLIGQLTNICTMVPPVNCTDADVKELNALVGFVNIALTPYAIGMLDEQQSRYMSTFVHMHINTVNLSICDVDFNRLAADFLAYFVSSTEYRTQQAAAATVASRGTPTDESRKRKAEDNLSETAKLTKVIASFTKAMKSDKSGRGNQGRDKPDRGGRGRNPPTLVLIPVSERCSRCVAEHVRKNPGSTAEQARVNHRVSECKRSADERALQTHANMAVTTSSQPEGVAAFMAGLTGSCMQYKFYIDSGANAVLVNHYYRHLMYDVTTPLADTSIEGIGDETNLRYELIGKIRFMGIELNCLYASNISKSVLGVSVLCSTGKFKLVFDDDYVIVINKHSKTQYKA